MKFDLQRHCQTRPPSSRECRCRPTIPFTATKDYPNLDLSMAPIYDHPETYDLEHANDEPDVAFFQSVAEKLQPVRILEVACGTGRLTRPLARTAESWGGRVSGIDNSEKMLAQARSKNLNCD